MRIIKVFILCLSLFCVGFSSNPIHAAQDLESVTLQLSWKNQFQFAGYYVAKELGYYQDAGLDVTIKEYESGIEVTADVLSQKTHFGIDRSSIFLEAMEGKPVTLLAALFQQSPNVLLAKKRDDLQQIYDLKGKKIMVASDDFQMAPLTAMLAINGIQTDSYTAQKNTHNIDDLISGNTDAISAYTSNEPFQLQKRGVDYTIFAPKDHGLNFYGEILFTSQNFYKEKPLQVEQFHQASLRGWEYAFSHMEEVVEIILNKYNTQHHSREALLFEANTLKTLAFDGDTPLGNINNGRMEQIAQIYRLLGFTNKPLNTDNLIFRPKDRTGLHLTPEEQTWLDANHTVRARVGNAPPLHFFDGKYRGISVDYLNLIASRVGFNIQYVTDIPWSKALDNIKKHEINDLLLTAKVTPERQTVMTFTRDYLLIPMVIFTQKNNSIDAIDALLNKTVSVEKNYVVHKKLVSEYPGITLLVKETTKDAMEAVATGQADAYIGNLTIGAYIIDQYNFTNLTVSAPSPFDDHNQAMAIRDDWPELAGIINKTFTAITQEEHTAIRKKWLSIDYKQELDESETLDTAPGTPVDTIELTSEERTWLADHRKIVVGGEEDWAPFDFVDKTGQYTGIANDYLNMIGKTLGIEVEIITGFTWNELLSMMRRKEIDVLPAIYHSREREAFVRFTDPYIKLTEFIFSRSDDETISSFDDLKNKTIVVVKGYTIEKEIRSNYPEYDLVTAPTIQDALKKIVTHEADAFIGDIISTAYNIKDLSLIGVKPIAPVPFQAPTVHMAIRRDWPVLKNLINKALKTIPESEQNAIENQWIFFAEKKIEMAHSIVTFSTEEQAWLDQHPVIRVHNEKEWPPFNYFEYGTPSGLSIDYMDLVAERLGIQVEYVTGPSWSEFLGLIQEKNLDVMLNIVKTDERQKYLLYTEPYVKNPNVIVSTRKNAYNTIEQLSGKTVAFPKGFFYEEVLTKSFPQIERLALEDTVACLKAVSFGKAEAALGEEAVVHTLMVENMLSNLHISGEVRVGNPDLVNLRIAIRNDWPLLHSAIMKVMAGVSPLQMSQLQKKWLFSSKATAADIPLTDEETAWIQTHPHIKVNGGEWPPFIIRNENGETTGISTQILDLAAGLVGLTVEYVDGPWPKMQEMLKNQELDLLQCFSKTPAREKFIHFTTPYMTPSMAIFVRKQNSNIRTIADLKGQMLAVEDGTYLQEMLKSNYPDIQLVSVGSTLDGLRKVSNGETTAYIGTHIVAQYELQKHLLSNLKVAVYIEDTTNDLRFGARSDYKILADIIQKALALVTENQKQQIITRYISMGGVPGPQDTAALTDAQQQDSTPQPKTLISFKHLIIYIAVIFMVVSLLAWTLLKIIRKENIAVSFGSTWFRVLVLAGLSIFVGIIVILGWYNLESNKAHHKEDVDENLRGILSVGEDRLDIWLQERVSLMSRLGRDPEIVAITKRLLQVEPNKRALLASSALREARFFFEHTEGLFNHIGFFIIDPDHISIGSMRNTNIGTRNLISEQHPELLQQTFQGKVGFVPPMTSDVHLGNSSRTDKAKKPPTMFFIGPVLDTSGKVLAAMTLRVDPWKDFSRAMTFFGSARTGETYAFDRQGRMLSPSRFEEQLHRIGLLEKGQGSALNIEVRDPGDDMVKGYRPGMQRSQQPLTKMASRALALRQQMKTADVHSGHSRIESDTEGYRDYRGVTVFGAWLWNAALDLGVAVEIDTATAMAHYQRTRTMIFGILGFTLFLSVGAILFVMIIGERTSHALTRAKDNLETKVLERTSELMANQEKLAEAEGRSRMLLNSAGEGIFGVDTEGICTFANPAALNLLGYNNEELVGRNIHEAIHHSLQDGSVYPVKNCPMHKTFTTGTSHHVDDEVLWKKDGTPFPVEYSSTPMEKDDKLIGAVITFRDITERKAAEDRFSALLESAPDAMVVSNETGEIVLINSQAEKLFGYSRKELLGNKIDMLVPEEIRDVHPDYRAKFYADPKRLSMGFGNDFFGVAKDGRRIPADVGLSPIKTDDGLLVVASVRDITERIEAEKALRDSEKQLQGILDTSPVGVAFSTKEKIHFANPRFKEMFGVGPGDAAPDLYVNPEEGDTLVSRLKAEGKIENYEIQLYNRDQQVRDVLINYLPLTFDEEEGILGWMLDITDRKIAEREIKEKFDELARFRRLAIGREQKMIDLKKEINELAEQLGQDQKYKIVT
jgi:PAS domain S-box-containing protein